jgi:hypothetical protein
MVVVLIIAAGAIWYFAMQNEEIIPPPPSTEITGTVIHLKLDGNLVATKGNTATLVGMAKPTTDKAVGTGAYQFDGTESYIDEGTSTAFDGKDTVWISAWVKFASLRHSYVAWKDGSYLVQLYPNNGTWEIQGGIYNTNASGAIVHWNLVTTKSVATFKPEINKWYHIVYQYDKTNSAGPQAVLYVNGALMSTKSGMTAQMSVIPTAGVRFGGRGQAGWDRNMNGVLDDVRVGNKPLSLTDVTTMYNAGTTITPASIVSVQ